MVFRYVYGVQGHDVIDSMMNEKKIDSYVNVGIKNIELPPNKLFAIAAPAMRGQREYFIWTQKFISSSSTPWIVIGQAFVLQRLISEAGTSVGAHSIGSPSKRDEYDDRVEVGSSVTTREGGNGVLSLLFQTTRGSGDICLAGAKISRR